MVLISMYCIGEKGVIIIGRDKVATGDAAYEIVPNGFRLDGPASAPIASGEIVITHYDR